MIICCFSRIKIIHEYRRTESVSQSADKGSFSVELHLSANPLFRFHSWRMFAAIIQVTTSIHYYYLLRHHLHHHHNLRRPNPSSDLEILNFPYKYIVHIFIFVLHLSSNSVYNLTFYGFSTWDGRSAVIGHFLSRHRPTSEHVPRYTRQYRVGSCAGKLDHHHSPSASSNQQYWWRHRIVSKFATNLSYFWILRESKSSSMPIQLFLLLLRLIYN